MSKATEELQLVATGDLASGRASQTGEAARVCVTGSLERLGPLAHVTWMF